MRRGTVGWVGVPLGTATQTRYPAGHSVCSVSQEAQGIPSAPAPPALTRLCGFQGVAG